MCIFTQEMKFKYLNHQCMITSVKFTITLSYQHVLKGMFLEYFYAGFIYWFSNYGTYTMVVHRHLQGHLQF